MCVSVRVCGVAAQLNRGCAVKSVRTFDHDHVDVDGADGRLRQSGATVQRMSHVQRSYILVRTLPVRKQLPQRHA